MAGCEKCWTDAWLMATYEGKCGGDRVKVYHELLEERKDHPCSPREQAGEWWDEKRQCDRRFIKKGER